MPLRFLTRADVTKVLNISAAQAYALVRTGELPAIQVRARRVWRVEAKELEATSSACTPRPGRVPPPAALDDVDPDEQERRPRTLLSSASSFGRRCVSR